MNFGKKIGVFNYRPILSIWLFFMAGIIFSVGVYVKDALYLTLSIFVVFLFIVTLIVKAFVSKRIKLFKIVSVIVAFMVGVGLTFITLTSYDNKLKFKGDYNLTGKICSYTATSKSGLKVVSLEDVTIIKKGEQSLEKLDGEVRLYLEQGNGQSEDVELGDIISGTFSLKNVDYLTEDGVNFYFITKNIDVLGFGSEDDIIFTGKADVNIFDKIKIKTRQTLGKFMSEDFSELGYTMLFGDKANLDEQILDIYSASGISHLLAVSGLHVGFVVTLFGFILSIFKVSDKSKFCILSVLTFIYTFLCGFSVSVTRAFIMTVVLLFSKLRFKKYDSLSSVSLAGIIILVWNPLFLFDIGFQLSFAAVTGIILFSRTLTKFFNKFLHEKLSSSLGVSLAATIGTLLILMASFKKLSIFSVVTNMIVIPLASVAYMIMFAFVLLHFLIPSLGVFIYMFEAIMRVVTGVGQITGSISLAGCEQCFVLLFGLFLIATALFVSDYVMLKKKNRTILSLISAGSSLVCLLLMFIC